MTHQPAVIARGVDAHLEDGVLRCRLVARPCANDNVTWTLHRGSFEPWQASAPVVGGDEWEVKLPDVTNGFAVRAVVGGVTYQSEWFQHFSTETVHRYREWRSEGAEREGSEIRPMPLFRYEAPFEPIAFVSHNDELDLAELKALASSNGLALGQDKGVHLPIMTTLTGAGSASDEAGNHFVFSGISRTQDHLLLGTTDAAANIRDVGQLRDAIGEFHLLSWNGDAISFEHDYIGQAHLFYFEGDGLFAAANGLHLLALVLRAVGVELRIDPEIAKSVFFSTSYPFEFHHGALTDFAGVRRVSVYERIEIRKDGPRLVKTQMWHDNLDGDLTDDEYAALLARAQNEIVDNLRVALDDPRFDHVILELSAGLDSRILFAALTTLPRSGKVRISTRRGAEERVAAQINNLYGFPWDALPKQWSFDEGGAIAGLPATSHSVFMDGYYIESMFKPRANYTTPTLLITGHGGEAFSRVMSVEGYFARSFEGELPPGVHDFYETRDEIVRYIGNHVVWLEAGKQFFPDVLRDALASSPASNFARKFEDLYVSERNPFVCGSVFRGAMSAPQWRPLHSKALFRLKALWFQQHQDYTLQFDLIRALNPLVSEAPYIKPIENARKHESHAHHRPSLPEAPLAFDDDVAMLTQARSEAAAASVRYPSREEFDRTRSAIEQYEESPESFLGPLRRILDLSDEFEDMGLPLFAYVDRFMNRTDPRSFSKRHNVRNKLHILLQELLLTTTDAPGAFDALPESQAAGQKKWHSEPRYTPNVAENSTVNERARRRLAPFAAAVKPLFFARAITYVDVGAYTGEVFDLFTELGPEILDAHLIEANPDTFAVLAEKFKTDRKAILHHTALGDRDGTVQLELRGTMSKVIEADTARNSASIPVTTLDSLMAREGVDHIHLLKIDVEGSELRVIEGAASLLAANAIDVIYIEAGMSGDSKQQVHHRDIELALEPHGYRLMGVYEQTHEWIDDLATLRRANLGFISQSFAESHPFLLSRELMNTSARVDALTQRVAELEAELEAAKHSAEQHRDKAAAELSEAREESRAAAAASADAASNLAAERDALRAWGNETDRRLRRVLASRWWRLTRLPRGAVTRLRRALGKPGRAPIAPVPAPISPARRAGRDET